MAYADELSLRSLAEISAITSDQHVRLRASRRDAATHLHELARRSRRLSDLDVPQGRLATLIAALVDRPG